MIAQNLKLTPLWVEQAPIPDGLGCDPLPEKADIAIVGGGYTGLTAARRLAQGGVRVTVIDKNSIGLGASSQNGGKALVGLKPEATTLFRRYGPVLGRQLWQASLTGINEIEETIKQERIECDFTRCGSFFAACKPKHYESMCRMTEWLKENLGYERENVPKSRIIEEIGTKAYFGGVVDAPSAGLHPAKFAMGLASAAKRAGANLCDETEVKNISRNNGNFKVAADRGEVKAREVIVAVNGYADRAVPGIRKRVIPIGSYIIATEPLPEEVQKRISPKGRMFYDSKWFLNYFRITPDGRMLFGGRTAITPDQDLKVSAKILKKDMVRMFPLLKDVKATHSWGGRLGLTFDMLPHIGRISGIHYALGYSGHGVAMSTHLGNQIADLILGRRQSSPFLELKHPTYFFYQGKAWFRPLLELGLKLLDKIK
jgi:glycine/D-amino acid oxidase-like deaminating enzyme